MWRKKKSGMGRMTRRTESIHPFIRAAFLSSITLLYEPFGHAFQHAFRARVCLYAAKLATRRKLARHSSNALPFCVVWWF